MRYFAELPPLWLGYEGWPACCGSRLYLMEEHAPETPMSLDDLPRRSFRYERLRNAVAAYSLLDTLSVKVPGPFSLLGLDQHVRLISRAAALVETCAHATFLLMT